MKFDRVKDFIAFGSITIPKLLIMSYKKLELSSDELIVLIYLIGNGIKQEFNYKDISRHIHEDENKILELCSNLNQKGFIEIKIEKNDKGILEENILLNGLYNKLTLLLLEEEEVKTEDTFFETFEREFGRTLSPMEYEIINAWLNDNFSEEVILEALKEAIYNGVSNLRYIDRIIYEWRKKGLKTIEDIRKSNEKFRSDKQKTTSTAPLFDYNWLEDNE